MILYRLTKTRHLTTAWSGYGAKQGGGRWNSIGTSMVYLSQTASLTMLETLAHLNETGIMDSFTLLQIEIPDDHAQQANMSSLPDDWSKEKAPPELSAYGDAWVNSGSSIALRVPSALCPVEYNYLINPEHPDFHRHLHTVVMIPFKFDTRLK